MMEENSLSISTEQEKYYSLASFKASHEDSKKEEASETCESISKDPFSTNSIVGHKPFNLAQTKEGESVQYDQESDESDEEVVLKLVKPGQDGREPVRDTTTFPYSALGRLEILCDGEEYTGSGTLISPRHVLTVAHNLYFHQHKKEPDSIVFIPGLNGEERPYGTISAKRWLYPYEYKDGRIAKYEDYGIVELEQDIGDRTGFMEMRAYKAHELENLECSIYGYPTKINGQHNYHLYGMSHTVSLDVERNILIYIMDVDNGQSGSSIYYKSAEGNYYTIGVHSRGYESHNEGLYLTREKIAQINKWMENRTLKTKHNLGNLVEVYGRDEYMTKLRNIMRFDRESSIISLSGIAGVGKSTIALKFAYDADGSYDIIWWIEQDKLESCIQALAEKCRLEVEAYEDVIDILINHINSSTSRFLLIFDNLEDESIIKKFLNSRGHFIITTQLIIPEVEQIEVSTLSREASLELLSSKLPSKSNQEYETLANLAQGLPLALVQLASSVSKYKINISKCEELFPKIIERTPELKNIVTKNIVYLSEESKHILKIACIGHYDNIPYDILFKVFIYKYPDTSYEYFQHYLDECVRCSIIKYDLNTEVFKIHRVIQQASALNLGSIGDELINDYSKYLYYYYDPQPGIFRRDEIDHIYHITHHAIIFLDKYKTKIPPPKVILLNSKVAVGQLYSSSDRYASVDYAQIIEESLNSQKIEVSDLVKVYNNLGVLYEARQDYAKSQQYQFECIERLAQNDPYLARVYNSLGALYRSMRDDARSEEFYSYCRSLRESILHPNHPDLARVYNSLGELYRSKQDYYKSLEYYTKCIRIMDTIINQDHPDRARILNIIGELTHSVGDYKASEGYFLEYLRIMETILPRNHPNLGPVYKTLGELNYSFGNHIATEKYYSKYLSVMRRIIPEDHPDLANIYSILGKICYQFGKYRPSEQYYYMLLTILNTILDPNHPNLAQVCNTLGIIYKIIGEYDRSEEHLMRCLNIRQNILNEHHPDLAEVYNNLGDLYVRIQQYEKSESYLMRCLNIRQAILPEDHSDLAQVYNSLGLLYLSMKQYEMSGEYMIRCLNIKEAILPPDHPDLAQVYYSLGSLYFYMGVHGESEEYYLKCLRIRELILPGNHPDIAQVCECLGSLYLSMGFYEASEEYNLRCLGILQRMTPQDHHGLAELYRTFIRLYDSMGRYNEVEEYRHRLQGIPA